MTERIIYSIYEELLQSACEANLGRELNETELKRIHCVLFESERFFDAIYGALIEAGDEAMNGEGWEEWDKMYANKTLEELST